MVADRRMSAPSGVLCLLVLLMAACGGGNSIAVGVNQLPPTITTQPGSQTVSLGATATFSVSVSGASPFTFQWQRNGTSITGATSATYTTPTVTVADNGATFQVIVSNAAGSQTSNAATLSVSQAPAISSQPANQTVNIGSTATFSVTASGAAPLAYQWQRNGANIGGNAAGYTTPPAAATDNGAMFQVIVSNGAGSQTSNPATLSVNLPPTIATQPASLTVSIGATATFSVVASGTPPFTYQWQENGANITGATFAGYTSPPVALADTGAMFTVIVTNPFGSQASNPATLTVSATAPPGTDVTTYKNDLARTAQNLTETKLTLANVNSTNFGLLRSLSVTGKVDAQPLYLSQFTISGVVHNVVYVATEHDLVYAFDSDTGATLWSKSLLGTGETTSDNRGCDQVTPEIGITATPVIDRNAGTHGVIYAVAMSKDGSGKYHQRLHALDLTTGAELFGGPTEVQASLTVLSGTNTFDPKQYKERPGLLLLNGLIYTMWSSHCDNQPYTSWIMSYNQTTLALNNVFNIGPNAGGAGPSIWMSGGAPAVDASGNIYVLAANGVFEQTLTATGFPSEGDYGNAFVKISTTGGVMSVTDYFEELNEMSENGGDTDLGSGGAMLLPDLTDGTGTVRHLAVGAGKDTNIYVVDRGNMGKFSLSRNNIYQELDGVLPGGIWSTPAYFQGPCLGPCQGTVYYGSVGSTLQAFTITNAKLSTSATVQTANNFPYPGTAPAVSANGTTNGIVWAAENSSPATLHAYNAATLAELYNSGQAGSRDRCGSGNKFITPTIADGKVFLGTQNSVCVFGLLP
jgi:hypothetical protein